MGKEILGCLFSFFFIANILAQGVQNEYRFDGGLAHPLSKKLVTFSGVGLVLNPDKHQNEYYFSFPGILYTPKKWLQFWGGFKDFYTNNWEGENTNEMRPYGGVKFLVPNSAKVHLFNFTQYEYRHLKKVATKSVQQYSRIRNRFGLEVPLSVNAWKPKTFYMMADAEPFYRFDDKMVDQVRLRMGPGYVINRKIRIEFLWRMQVSRSISTDPLTYTGNTFRLNLKISTIEGLFERLLHPDFEID